MNKLLLMLALSIAILSCKKNGGKDEDSTKTGCTNPKAGNYNKEAIEDDGSCVIGYTGVYYLKDSVFYNEQFTDYREYQLTVEFLSTEDSIVLKELRGVSITNDMFATKTETSLNIHEQPFDPNAIATGSGTFDFGLMTLEFSYGVVRHSCVGTKN